jgi:hypothetical protein
MAPKSPELIFNFHVALIEATDLERSEVDVPDAIVDLLEPDILPSANDADINPRSVPTNAAIGADVAYLEAIRILKGSKPVRHGSL